MNEHIAHQLPDYVLNLLPKMERQSVEQHTAVCSQCQYALKSEREIGQMVRLTLQTATQPAHGRLAQLMPPIPAQKQGWPVLMMGWQRQLAVVGLLVAILFGSFGVWNGRSHNIWGVPSPATLAATTLATTATSTQDATATLTQQTTEAQETLAAEGLTVTAVASPTAQAYIITTPAPQPTPIAAIPASIATN
ncbi:MAG: hypothetical protein GWP17_04590 [Aquificales bacterium]|nr:hypothetical protein [Aquificales bacterium]